MYNENRTRNFLYKKGGKTDTTDDFDDREEKIHKTKNLKKNFTYTYNNSKNNINNNNSFNSIRNIKEDKEKKLTVDEIKKDTNNRTLNNQINYDQFYIEEEEEENNQTNTQDSELPLITLNLISVCQCCKNKFDKNKYMPYLLKCGHFFCINCIRQYFTHQTGIVCPTDGLIAKSIKELKLLKNLIIDSKRPTLTETKKERNILKQIDKLDNFDIQKNNFINNYCSIHPDQKKSHLINNTNEIICIHCAFEKLKSNPNLEIIEVKEKINEFNNVIENIINNCQKNIDIIHNTIKLIDKNKENEEKKLSSFYHNLIEIIQSQKYQKIQQLENIYAENMHNLEKKLFIFNEIIEQGEKFINNIEEDYNIINNFKNILINYKILLKLNRSNNEDSINNKLKYVKFSNEKETVINDYLNKISYYNIIHKKIKYIKNDPSLKNDTKKTETSKNEQNDKDDISDQNKNIIKTFKKIYDNKLKNKTINEDNQNRINTQETDFFTYNTLDNDRKNKSDNKLKNSKVVIKTPRLKKFLEIKNNEDKNNVRDNKPHINKNKLLESYYELKSEKNNRLNNYYLNNADTQRINNNSFNNLNILNNFYNLNYARKAPNSNSKKSGYITKFNYNNFYL